MLARFQIYGRDLRSFSLSISGTEPWTRSKMYRQLLVLLGSFHFAVAAPQGFTVITVWPPLQNSTLPSTTPTPTPTSEPTIAPYNPCDEGFTPDYRGWCRPTTTSSRPWCPSGFASDYEGYCHRISTTTSSSASKFTCSSGFIPDYRGYSYCRKTFPYTPYEPPTPFLSTTTMAPVSSSYVPVRSYMPGGCSSGWITDYRGYCILTAPRPQPTIEKRIVTTKVVEEDISAENLA
ncbi:hypothetical protein BDV96DRAFT_280604 [Lophiotrema nucula]|uniref:Uncharacterized protein n=1 Tax=Lophiotrema nucula TaxID=690887 RepID=A0A6A5ZNY4_9PLEO|nr:hypothetical protein BDV96DRAFT_280604 [Lophiotrema nucula]